MDQGKLLAFIIAIGLAAVFYATVFQLIKKSLSRTRNHSQQSFDDLLELVVKKTFNTEYALYILMAYKNYYDCCESDRDYLVDGARIALHAVIKKYGTDPCFDFLKEEVTYD